MEAQETFLHAQEAQYLEAQMGVQEAQRQALEAGFQAQKAHFQAMEAQLVAAWRWKQEVCFKQWTHWRQLGAAFSAATIYSH